MIVSKLSAFLVGICHIRHYVRSHNHDHISSMVVSLAPFWHKGICYNREDSLVWRIPNWRDGIFFFTLLVSNWISCIIQSTISTNHIPPFTIIVYNSWFQVLNSITQLLLRMSRWEIALINIMIMIINKCLFYYLYIVFKTSTPIEWGNEYKNLDTVIFILRYFSFMHSWYSAYI